MDTIDIETAGKIFGALHNTSFACPHCGHEYDGADSETAEHVVSLWGEDGDYDLSCDECGKDFVVRETVMRSFETARTSAEIDLL